MLAGLPADAAVAAAAFVGTNVEGASVTAAMLVSATPGRARRIATGRVAGFIVLVLAAAGTAVALFEVPTRVVGVLGLVPLALGLRGLAHLRPGASRPDPSRRAVGSGLTAAALVTVGTGGSSLAAYIPLIRASGALGLAVTASVFVTGDVLLTYLVVRLARRPRAGSLIGRAGAWAAPVLYCGVGVLVLIRAGTVST